MSITMGTSGVWAKDRDCWVTEASDLKGTGKPPACPACGKGFLVGPVSPRVDQAAAIAGRVVLRAVTREGDVTHWTGTCPCGECMVVFND